MEALDTEYINRIAEDGFFATDEEGDNEDEVTNDQREAFLNGE